MPCFFDATEDGFPLIELSKALKLDESPRQVQANRTCWRVIRTRWNEPNPGQ